MTIAGIAVGATKGYIYVRSEYPHAVNTLREAIRIATAANWLGRTIQGSPHDFELYVRMGAGAYICGEETSMLESLEGKRGLVRYKPPLPAHRGSVRQADRHQQRAQPRLGADHPRQGRRVLSRLRRRQIARHARLPARRQHQAGRPRREGVRRHRARADRGLWRRHAVGPPVARRAGRRSARRLSSRTTSSIRRWTTRRSPKWTPWSAMAASSCSTTRSTWRSMARFAMEFCVIESCGKCTPCRIGSVRGVETIDRIIAGIEREREHRDPRGSLQYDDRRLAVRHGRVDADAGDERVASLPGGFQPPGVRAEAAE